MKSILVFIDGTICATRRRHSLIGMPGFFHCERILQDSPVPGSINCLNALSQRYEIVYIGARPESARLDTEGWLKKMGYPKGAVYLDENQQGRLSLVKRMIAKFDFLAGIGDRWVDNELHAEIGCHSIILQEYEGKWADVVERIEKYHRLWRIETNRIHLQGKVEGLARVCPLLLANFGEQLWDTYFNSVIEMAETTRMARKMEDLASFASHGLDTGYLRDAAR